MTISGDDELKALTAIGRIVAYVLATMGRALVTDLGSHGVGRSLHEEPSELATWPDAFERRRIADGAAFTIEPFFSFGARGA